MKTIYTLILVAICTLSNAANSRTDIQLRLTDTQIGGSDLTSVAFKTGFAPNYSATEDVEKTFNNGTQGTQLYTVTTDNIACSVNNYSALSQTETITLGYVAYHTGSYIISISSAQNVDATTLIILEDKADNSFQLLNNASYTFTTDSGNYQNRFALHISAPVAISTLPANCSGVNGETTIATDAQAGWEEIAIIDSNGLAVQQTQNINGPVSFSNLTEGNYTVRLTYGAYSATLAANVSGTSVKANISSDVAIAATNSNIQFTGMAPKVQYYEWDMGEGTLITGVANPEYQYYEPGNYNVTLRVSNDYGCTDSATENITITQATGISSINKTNSEIYSAQKQLYIKMATMPETATTVSVYNIIGQNIYNGAINSSTTTIDLSAMQNGAYIVNLQQGRDTQTKRVYLY